MEKHSKRAKIHTEMIIIIVTKLERLKETPQQKNSIKRKNCRLTVPTLLYFSPSQVNVERRFFIFRFGDPRARMNWVHVDNLVMAHTLAAEALTLQRSFVSVSEDEHAEVHALRLP